LQEFTVKYSNLVSLFGRQLFSIIFILSSASHFDPSTVEEAAQHGVPLAGLLVPLSGIVALAGGLSVLLGYQTRLGAWLLTLFLVPVTLTMHDFWAAPDARAFQVETALFLRNVALLGGALLIGHFGGGPLSLDALIHGEKEVGDPIRTPHFVPAAVASPSASEDAAPVRQQMTGSRS
jgi:putative oxidoreductase